MHNNTSKTIHESHIKLLFILMIYMYARIVYMYMYVCWFLFLESWDSHTEESTFAAHRDLVTHFSTHLALVHPILETHPCTVLSRRRRGDPAWAFPGVGPRGAEVTGEGQRGQLGVHLVIEVSVSRPARDQPRSVKLTDIKTVSPCLYCSNCMCSNCNKIDNNDNGR